MIIKYETLWDHLDELFEFLDIPKEKIKNFPKKIKRNINWKDQPEEIKNKLYNIYKNINEQIKEFPEIKII